LLGFVLIGVAVTAVPGARAFAQDTTTADDEPAFTGMDEAVNETLAADAGRPSREPYIDTESWGELWNLLLLAAGAISGFLVGRHWDQLWGRRSPSKDESPEP
jgi:hypothetical protein